MLIIASTGRCGTVAMAHGLSRYTDLRIDHEPEPQLLREAFLKHIGAAHRTEPLESRLEWLLRQEPRYGLAFRAAPLLEDLAEALPDARFLLAFREPQSYVRSAMRRGVLLRGDAWDIYRILPLDIDLSDLRRPEVIALHWREVNRYLLDFSTRRPERSRLMAVRDLESQIFEIAEFADAQLGDRRGLAKFVAARPNRAAIRDALRELRSGDTSSLIALWDRLGSDHATGKRKLVMGERVRRTVDETWEQLLAAERRAHDGGPG